jgi:hypothetical protein
VAEHGLGLIAAFEIAQHDLSTEIFFALEMIVKRALGYTLIKRFWQMPAWPIETIVRDKKNDLAAIVLRSEL